MIVIRPPHSAQDFQQIERLQQIAWQVTPQYIFHAWLHAGGIVLCAFDDQRMVGFVAGFLGEVEGKRLHWSHMLLVEPEYRRNGIGKQLKFAQREAALKQGLNLIGWTFDPLRKENALLNMESLGATCSALHLEFYGQRSDNVNEGRLTDRFEVRWDLKSERAKACAKGKGLPPQEAPQDYLLRAAAGLPALNITGALDRPSYALEIPQAPTYLHDWNYALREAALPLLKAGYNLERVYTDPEHPETFAYIFQRPAAWYLYILETADGSFYTGITVDLDQRIAAHNAGRGAKYTASRRPVRLLGAWETFGQAQATRLEYRLKRLTRPQKLKLIETKADFEDVARYY